MTKSARSNVFFWALLALLVGLFVVWQWRPIHSFAWKYDEGINAVKAKLLLRRHRLYKDIWSDQPPFFTFMLAGSFALFGQNVVVGRLLVLALAVLAVFSLASITLQVSGKTPALLGAVALLSFPHFHELSQLIMIGLPAISLGLLALALAFRHWETREQKWLLWAGGCFGLGLLIKPIIAPMILPLSVISLGTWEKRIPAKKRMCGGVRFALAVLMPVLVAFVLCSPRAFAGQVVGTLFEAREARESHRYLMENARQLGAYLFHDKWGVSHAGLSSLALIGTMSLLLDSRWDELLVLGTWLGGVLAAVVLHVPLRRHQLLLVLPPLIVTAALSIQHMLELTRGIGNKPARERLLAALALMALLPVGINLPKVVRANMAIRETLLAEDEESNAGRGAIHFLRTQTPEGGHVITDDPMLAFKADRAIPPALAVPSARRIETGELSSQELIRLTTSDAPYPVVLFWEQRLTRLDEYPAWVRQNYHAVHAYVDDRWIYAPPDMAPITFPQSVSTKEGIRIVGSHLNSLAAEAGADLSVTIFLQIEKPLGTDYTLFAHLLGEQGNVWGQRDLPPLDRQYLSSAWAVGETVAQTVHIAVAQGAPPGEKILSVGLYGPAGDRLLLYGPEGNALQSKQVVLKPRPVVRWQAIYASPAMEHRQQTQFGDYVELLGYDGPTWSESGNQTLEITLYWRCLRTMNTSYTAFVHLLDKEGNLVAQQDQIPGQGAYPTSGWLAGEMISDTYTIGLPTGLDYDTYRLSVGLYELSTAERLPVRAEGQLIPERRILLDQGFHYEP
jgi:4-amino-4-deoxy-L-arabinose transferase-like glycosyltransferase